MGYVPEHYKLVQTTKDNGVNKKSAGQGSVKNDKKSGKNNYD